MSLPNNIPSPQPTPAPACHNISKGQDEPLLSDVVTLRCRTRRARWCKEDHEGECCGATLTGLVMAGKTDGYIDQRVPCKKRCCQCCGQENDRRDRDNVFLNFEGADVYALEISEEERSWFRQAFKRNAGGSDRFRMWPTAGGRLVITSVAMPGAELVAGADNLQALDAYLRSVQAQWDREGTRKRGTSKNWIPIPKAGRIVGRTDMAPVEVKRKTEAMGLLAAWDDKGNLYIPGLPHWPDARKREWARAVGLRRIVVRAQVDSDDIPVPGFEVADYHREVRSALSDPFFEHVPDELIAA